MYFEYIFLTREDLLSNDNLPSARNIYLKYAMTHDILNRYRIDTHSVRDHGRSVVTCHCVDTHYTRYEEAEREAEREAEEASLLLLSTLNL